MMEPVRVVAWLPEGSMSTTLTEATAKVFAILDPLPPEDRHKVINAVLMLLGEAPGRAPTSVAAPATALLPMASTDADGGLIGLSPQAKGWARKNRVTMEELSQYFHIDEAEVQVPGIPADGRNKKEQVVVCYIFQGLAAFLRTGDSSFTDDDARELCKREGCYDPTNHTKAYKDFGNRLVGAHKTGWKLTRRGEEEAAKLIKSSAESS
jgi:hypothetical protein